MDNFATRSLTLLNQVCGNAHVCPVRVNARRKQFCPDATFQIALDQTNLNQEILLLSQKPKCPADSHLGFFFKKKQKKEKQKEKR